LQGLILFFSAVSQAAKRFEKKCEGNQEIKEVMQKVVKALKEEWMSNVETWPLYCAKIIGVADVVEAMSSHRPYRPALGIDVALDEIIQNKGILYDPEVVAACVKLFREKGFKLES